VWRKSFTEIRKIRFYCGASREKLANSDITENSVRKFPVLYKEQISLILYLNAKTEYFCYNCLKISYFIFKCENTNFDQNIFVPIV
jgi:hypothetical protein